jgi:histone deacetylase 1/2
MSEIPRQSFGMTDEEEAELHDIDEDKNKGAPITQLQKDEMIVDEDGYVSDSEGEGDEYLGRASKRRKIR